MCRRNFRAFCNTMAIIKSKEMEEDLQIGHARFSTALTKCERTQLKRFEQSQPVEIGEWYLGTLFVM